MRFTYLQRTINFGHAGLVVNGEKGNDVVALALVEKEHFKGKLREGFGPDVDAMGDIGAIGVAVDGVDRSKAPADGDDFGPNAAEFVEFLTGLIAVSDFGLRVNCYPVAELSRLVKTSHRVPPPHLWGRRL